VDGIGSTASLASCLSWHSRIIRGVFVAVLMAFLVFLGLWLLL
jgi:hypothetical protein